MNITIYMAVVSLTISAFLCAAQSEKEPAYASRVTTLRLLQPTKQLAGVDALLATNPVEAHKKMRIVNEEFKQHVESYQASGAVNDYPFIKRLKNSLNECEKHCSFFGVWEWAKILTWDSYPRELAIFTDTVAAAIVKMADEVTDRSLHIYRLGGEVGHFNDLVIFAKVFKQRPAFGMRLYHDNNDACHVYLQNADGETKERVKNQFLCWMQKQLHPEKDFVLNNVRNAQLIDFDARRKNVDEPLHPAADVIYALDEESVGTDYKRLCKQLLQKNRRFSGVMLSVAGRKITLTEDCPQEDSKQPVNPPPYVGPSPMAPAKPHN